MGATKKTRRYPRVGLPKEILVAWQSGAERIVSRVGTLGLGGLFISTPEPPAVGEIVKLFFEVPGGGCGPELSCATPSRARAWAWNSLRWEWKPGGGSSGS